MPTGLWSMPDAGLTPILRHVKQPRAQLRSSYICPGRLPYRTRDQFDRAASPVRSPQRCSCSCGGERKRASSSSRKRLEKEHFWDLRLSRRTPSLNAPFRQETRQIAPSANFCLNMSHDIRTPMNAMIDLLHLACAATHIRQTREQVHRYLKRPRRRATASASPHQRCADSERNRERSGSRTASGTA